MARSYLPDRGDIVLMDFTPASGHEQSGRRPAIVLSPQEYNRKVGLAVMCPITSQKKGYAFEVELPAECGVKGVVLADQVRSLDWKSRRATYVERGRGDVLEETVAKIAALVGYES